MPVIDIYANVEGRDLGAVSDAVARSSRTCNPACRAAPPSRINGQATTMHSAYAQLLAGLALSIVLIYLVIVVNFQSWLDPFIIITRPAGGLGRDRLEPVPDEHHAVGARADRGDHVHGDRDGEHHPGGRLRARSSAAEHGDPVGAAIEAGYARIRPVLMTALAMIVGMLPMSFSNTQNAPLGRAVIGGLLVATVTTLLFVPCVFAILQAARAASRNQHPRETPHERQAGKDGDPASRIAVGCSSVSLSRAGSPPTGSGPATTRSPPCK